MAEKMIAGETVIGTKNAKTKTGGKLVLNVLYGNKLATPKGKILNQTLPEDQYQQMLNDFLASPEGREYENPFAAQPQPDPEPIVPADVPEPMPSSGNRFVGRHRPAAAQQIINSMDNTAPQGYPAEDDEEDKGSSEVPAYGDSKSGLQNQEPEGDGEPSDDGDGFYEQPQLNDPEPVTEERKEETMSEIEKDINEEETEEEEEEYYEEGPNKLTIILGVVAGVFALASFVLGLMVAGVIPNPIHSKTNQAMISVVVANTDIEKGTKITEDMIAEGKITQDAWNENTGVQYVDGKGTVRNSMIVLWSNRKSVIGDYTTGAIAKDDCFTDADTTSIADGKNMLTLEVDGQSVTVPVSVTAAGTTDLKLYAIVSSADKDGKVTNAAFNLSTIKLEGRELIDILNSGDKSILESVLNAKATVNEKEATKAEAKEGEKKEEAKEEAPAAEKTEEPKEETKTEG